ncbi:hypothetical protein J6590_076844 [Homalodisca vitripennis]|nr:hypothetical protein J6590_076844 [Homalodisca vitripennis]
MAPSDHIKMRSSAKSSTGTLCSPKGNLTPELARSSRRKSTTILVIKETLFNTPLKSNIERSTVFERGGRIPVNGGDNFHQHLRDRPTSQGPVNSLKRNAIKALAYIKLSTRDRRQFSLPLRMHS